MEQLETRKESTVKDFLEVFFRRKWIILGIVVVAVTVVSILNLKEPAVYESSAKMLLRRGEAQSVFNSSIRTLSWEEEIASQIEMVKSQVIINHAQELLPGFLPEGTESRFRISPGGVNSGVISTSNVIWITYVSRDPVFCEAAVNAIVNAYKDYYQQIRTPPEMEDFFSSEIQAVRDEIDYWRARKETAEKDWGIVDLNRQKQEMLSRLGLYRKNLEEVTSERWEMESIVRKLESYRALGAEEQSNASSVFLNLMPGQNVIPDLRRRLMDLKVMESEYMIRFTDENKELIKVRKQIDDINAMINEEIESLLFVNTSKLEIIKYKERTLKDLMAPLLVESEEYPSKEIELERIEYALQRLENTLKNLLDQHMSAKISVASNPEWSVTILNHASKAYRRKTRDYVRMALGPFFSFMIALGFAFFIDNLDHSIKNISSAEEAFGLPVLASFPETD